MVPAGPVLGIETWGKTLVAIEVTQSTLLGLWVVAGVATLVVSFPMLLGLLGLSQFRSSVTEGPAEASPVPGDEAGEAIFDQVKELGVERLRSPVEQAWVFALHLGKSI